MESSLPVAERPRRPEWMKVARAVEGRLVLRRQKLIHGLSLHTICEEARCPNISECWGRGTATFQILGDTCTRACRYCYVHSGKPRRAARPARAAAARAGGRADAAQARRRHLGRPRRRPRPRCRPLRGDDPRAEDEAARTRRVEVLTPDFLGVEEEALQTVLARAAEVFNHNIETVRRLHRAHARREGELRQGALAARAARRRSPDYRRPDEVGIIVGLGETNDEVVETMRDLRANGVDVVTIGQYLQPSAKHAQIDRWVHPDEFRWFREQGEALGFGSVFSGPLVRSSYRADEQRHAAATGRGAVAYAILAAVSADAARRVAPADCLGFEFSARASIVTVIASVPPRRMVSRRAVVPARRLVRRPVRGGRRHASWLSVRERLEGQRRDVCTGGRHHGLPLRRAACGGPPLFALPSRAWLLPEPELRPRPPAPHRWRRRREAGDEPAEGRRLLPADRERQ